MDSIQSNNITLLSYNFYGIEIIILLQDVIMNPFFYVSTMTHFNLNHYNLLKTFISRKYDLLLRLHIFKVVVSIIVSMCLC